MDALSEYILKITDNTQVVKKWTEGGYKQKPLIILGNNGFGKSCLANYVLRNYVNILISISSCKKNISLEGYLNSSLYKKSITMMFEPDNVYKSLIFDDLNDIQKNDKQLFKSIIQFSKKKISKHPIIYIINSIENKYIKQLWSKSYQLKLTYTYDEISKITRKFFLKEPISDVNLMHLISKSNHNFNSIKVNIDYYKTTFTNIQYFDKKNNNSNEFIKHLICNMSLNTVYRECSSEYSTIGLNIIENVITFLDTYTGISQDKKLLLFDKIYTSHCIGDHYLLYTHITNSWWFINHIIHNMVVYPIFLVKKYNMEKLTIKYNTYISKCIISTFHKKILSQRNMTTYNLSILYKLLHQYQDELNISKKCSIKEHIINYIHTYSVDTSFIIKLMKYYQNMYDLNYKKTTLNLFF